MTTYTGRSILELVVGMQVHEPRSFRGVGTITQIDIEPAVGNFGQTCKAYRFTIKDAVGQVVTLRRFGIDAMVTCDAAR